MGDFVGYNSRWRLALLLLGSFSFVVLGLWMGGIFGVPPHSHRYPDGEIFVIGWFGVLFFGLCGVAIIKKFFDPREQLRIGPAGVSCRSWGEETVPWSEITDVTTWRYRRQNLIILHLRNPDRLPRRGLAGRLATINRELTGGDLSLNLAGTDCSYREAMAAIQRFRTVN